MDKEYILNEVKRLAAENGGTPPGYETFFRKTKLKKTYVIGNYWTKWSDVIRDAGLKSNNFPLKTNTEEWLEKLCMVIRKLNKFPTRAEMSLLRKEDKNFPDPNYVIRVLGGCKAASEKLIEHCSNKEEYKDVLEIVIPYHDNLPEKYLPREIMPYGCVYLVQLKDFCIIDKHYKSSAAVYIKAKYPRRLSSHIIKTDDPNGICLYWRRRFYAGFIRGNEFKLTLEQINHFKQRTLM